MVRRSLSPLCFSAQNFQPWRLLFFFFSPKFKLLRLAFQTFLGSDLRSFWAYSQLSHPLIPAKRQISCPPQTHSVVVVVVACGSGDPTQGRSVTQPHPSPFFSLLRICSPPASVWDSACTTLPGWTLTSKTSHLIPFEYSAAPFSTVNPLYSNNPTPSPSPACRPCVSTQIHSEWGGLLFKITLLMTFSENLSKTHLPRKPLNLFTGSYFLWHVIMIEVTTYTYCFVACLVYCLSSPLKYTLKKIETLLCFDFCWITALKSMPCTWWVLNKYLCGDAGLWSQY